MEPRALRTSSLSVLSNQPSHARRERWLANQSANQSAVPSLTLTYLVLKYICSPPWGVGGTWPFMACTLLGAAPVVDIKE